MSESRDCLNVAVVGCGYWGKHYVRITNTLQKTRCAMICDPCQSALDKMKILRDIINKKKLNIDIEIDGGINFDNSKKVKEFGANILVSGSTIFKENEGNLKKNIQLLRTN